MRTNLLATKLHQPAPPPKRVQRPLLIQRLNEGLESGRQITLVSAPAGFGKTTCVSEWVNAVDCPVTWLSLEPADDDPGRFFTYLVAALQRVDANLGREIEGVLRSGQLPPSEVISTTLSNDIQELEGRFLLVLDDFQVIQDRFILQVLEKLVANLPQPLHLVLLTREDPPLPLARLRANNQMTEFWIEGNFHRDIPLGMFMLQDIALAIVTTWLYNSTEGSLLIVHLFHAASNTTLGVLPILPMDTGGQLRPLWIAVGLLWVVAVGIVVVNGPVRLSRRRATDE